MKKLITLTLSVGMLACLLAGCKKETPLTPTPGTQGNVNTTSPTVSVDFAKTDTDMFSDRDLRQEYDSAGAVQIQLNGSSVSCSSPAVSVTGSNVSINQEGVYVLNGNLNDGSITISAGESDKVQLVLNGASITSRNSPAIFAVEGDKLFITTVPGTENALANGGNFINVETDAAVFSRMDLTVNGTGKLTVDSPVGNGICCKDDLVVTGGDLTVNAGNHGLDANDSIRITGTTLKIKSNKDGIHAENNDDDTLGFVYISAGTLTVNAEGDGISAGSTMQINDGSFTINTRSSSTYNDSMKAIKAGTSLLLSAGTYSIDSEDDAVHAGNAVINGGTYQITSGDDAIHADETLQITNGTIAIAKCYEGLEAHHVTVTGGDISMTCSDDGINAAGGNDSSGTQGGRNPMEPGARPGKPGGQGGHGGPGGPGGPGAAGDGSVTIAGGILNIISSGDGIDANGTLTITGGKTTITGPTQGDTATLDFDVSGGINGGTFIGTGGAGMAQTFSNSQQGVISVSVGNQAANTPFTLTDADGNVIISHTPTLPYAVVIISTPDMVKGAEYTFTIGDISEAFTAS